MEKLTYRKLKAILDKATDEQLAADVTIYVNTGSEFLGGDEFYGANEVKQTTEHDEDADGVLDAGHLYIVVGNQP